MRQQSIAISMAAGFFSVAAISTSLLAQPNRPPVNLPDGESKAMVEGLCIACHRLDFVPNYVGNTHEGWDALISTMIVLPDEQNDAVIDYLATHFPTKPGTAPVLIPGPVDVTISEWLAPTLGSRPHDPLAAADGSIWWTGQMQNRLGRVDPATGAIEEFPLDTPNSGPHGLVEECSTLWSLTRMRLG